MHAKTVITDFTGLSRDALHLVTGFGLHVALAILLRSWVGAVVPLAIVFAIAGANEWFDLMSDVWTGDARNRQWYESGKDMVLTLMAPLTLFLLGRSLPRVMVRGQAGSGSESERPSDE